MPAIRSSGPARKLRRPNPLVGIAWVVAILWFTPAGLRAEEARDDRSVAGAILFYVPNRVLDVLDVVRLRARIGPGFAMRVRATEGADLGLGSYAAIFAGLPGPRSAVGIPLPVGVETYTGVDLGPGDAQLPTGASPDYSGTEIGVSLHLTLVGFDVGVDPFEALDLLAGLFLFDLREDDY